MTSSEQIALQIAQMERQLAAKRQELDYVRTIEDLERQREEIERRHRQAELELQRHLANTSLAEVAAQEPEPTPTPTVAPGEPESDPEPVAESDGSSLSCDAALLVKNIVFRLGNLNPAGTTFDRDADEMINRVRTEGTHAIRYLTELLGLPYNQGQYRRMIKNALRERRAR